MVEKASEAFWRKLQSLAFISDTQIKNWRMLAQNANISWLELCQRIQTETVLGPNQLEILADPESIEAVAVGPFVIQRRLVHPSGWSCFEVLHAQLRQSLKLTWLPSEPEMHNALLRRVRQVALLTDDVTATIRDMDSRDGRTYVIQPLPQGPRLSELAASRESKAWLTDGLAESLVTHVFGVLDSELELGRLDPVNLWLEGPQGLKHDLLGAPWIDSESIPVGLAPQESAWLLTFRAARRRWESEQGSDGPKPQHPVLELASWLAGWSLPQATPAEAATFARWKHAAVDLWETVVGGSELGGWRERWFPMASKPVLIETGERGDRKPDSLVSQAAAILTEPAITLAGESESHGNDTNRGTTTAVNELGDGKDLGGCSEADGDWAFTRQANEAARETSDSADAATSTALSSVDAAGEPQLDGLLEVAVRPTIQVNVSAAVSKRGNDRARENSTSTAARLKKRKATEQKRRVVTAAAIALPFPIFLVGFLLAYLFWPAEDRVPDTPQSNASSPLPESGLPATSGPARGKVENTPAKSETREPGQQDDTNAAASLGNDDDAMLAGLDGDEEAELPLDDLNLNDMDGALGLDVLSDATSARTIDPVRPIEEVANSAEIDGGVEPPTTSSPAGAPPEPANPAGASTGSVSAPLHPPSDFQFDEPFASFSHLIASADFQSEGRGLGDRVSDEQSSYHLGWLNKATAQRVRLDWRSTSPAETGDGSPQVIESPPLSSDRETPGAPNELRKWRLVLPPQNDPLAIMEVASDGQVRLSIEGRQFWDIVPRDGHRLVWSYRDLEYEMRFDQGASPVPTDRASEEPSPDRQVVPDAQIPPVTVAVDDSVGSEIESSLNSGRSDAADAGTNVFDDRPFDTRTATLQSWSMETPEWPNGEEPQWRFWLGGEALVPLDKENPMWQAVRFRGSEQPYVLEDEFFDTGSVVVTLQADSGRKARLAGKLHLVTPNGLVPLKAGVAAQEALAADNFKILVQRQRDQLNSVRAKPGEGDRKRAELDRMDAVIKEVERYRKALDRSVENQDRWLEKGLAFSLARQVDGQSIEWAHSRGRPEPEEKKD